MDAKVYLHSAAADFADTDLLSPGDYLGRRVRSRPRGPMRWLKCGCDAERLVRIHRSGWTRWLPLLRLYACLSCRRRVLCTRGKPTIVNRTVYIPARPLRMQAVGLLGLLARLPPSAPWQRPPPDRG